MAENPSLEILIGADIKELEQALSQARKSLKQIEKATADAGSKNPDPFKPVKKSAKGALPALTDVSRVIQDAPFGIIGVGNNITQLADSFGRLSKETGGPISGIKALGASLAGPGGLVFGVSAVISLLTVLGPELFKLKGATSELAKAQAEAVGSAQAQALELNALTQIARSSTASDQAKANAIQQINEKYSSYIPNLKNEKELTGETVKLIDKVTDSLKKQALARGALDLITEKSKQLFEIQNDLSKSVNFSAIALGSLKNALDPTAASAGVVNEAYNEQQEEVAKLQKEINGLIFSYRELKEDALSSAPEKIEKVTKAIKKQYLAISQDAPTQDILSSVFAVNEDAEAALGQKLSDSVFRSLERTSAKLRADGSKFVEEGLSPIEQVLQNFNDAVEQIIDGGITDAFGGIGEALGAALVNGTSAVDGLATALLGSLGAMLSNLGDIAIATGVGLTAIKASLESLNPALAIGAGIALKALGAIFSAATSKLASNIGDSGGVGGLGAGGGSASAISSPSVLQGGESVVVFEIQGNKLVGVLNKTLARQGRNLNEVLSG